LPERFSATAEPGPSSTSGIPLHNRVRVCSAERVGHMSLTPGLECYRPGCRCVDSLVEVGVESRAQNSYQRSRWLVCPDDSQIGELHVLACDTFARMRERLRPGHRSEQSQQTCLFILMLFAPSTCGASAVAETQELSESWHFLSLVTRAPHPAYLAPDAP
jgi:hypothetical protein